LQRNSLEEKARLLLIIVYAALLAAGLLAAAYRPPAVAYEAPLDYEGVALARGIGHGPGGAAVVVSDQAGTRVVAVTPDGLLTLWAPGVEAGSVCSDGSLVVAALQDGPTLIIASWPGGAEAYTVEANVVIPRAAATACTGDRIVVLYSPYLAGPSFILEYTPGGEARLQRIPGAGWRWLATGQDALYVAAPDKLLVIEDGVARAYTFPENYTATGLQPGPVVLGSYNGSPAVLAGGSLLALEYGAGEGEGEALAYTESRGWASLLVVTPSGSLQYVQVSPGLEARSLDVIVGGAWARLDAWAWGDRLYLAGQRIQGSNKTLFLVESQGAIGVPVVLGWPDYILLVKQTPNQPSVRIERDALLPAGEEPLEPVPVSLEPAPASMIVEESQWPRTADPRIDYALLAFTVAALILPPAYAACRVLCG